MKKQENTKQKLFEMAEKIDPTFKPKIISESRDGFERKISFWVYDKNGSFLGETDPMGEEAEWFESKDEIWGTPEGQQFLQANNLSPEQIGRVQRERLYFMNGNPLSMEYYSPSQSQELYDDKTNTWYNRSGQQMRDPSEYERYPDGTNQWGERYDDDY